MPVSFVFALMKKQAEIKERNKKCLFVCVCALLSKSEEEQKTAGLGFVHGGLHWLREDVRYYLDN